MDIIVSSVLDRLLKLDKRLNVYKDHLGRYLCYFKEFRMINVVNNSIYICKYPEKTHVSFSDGWPVYKQLDVTDLKNPDSIAQLEQHIKENIERITGYDRR